MVKLIFVAASVFCGLTAANAQSGRYGYDGDPYGTGSNRNSHYVQPHYKNNGSYTSGYYRTNPNNTTSDNYGATGNYNPHNGRFGGSRYSNDD